MVVPSSGASSVCPLRIDGCQCFGVGREASLGNGRFRGEGADFKILRLEDLDGLRVHKLAVGERGIKVVVVT